MPNLGATPSGRLLERSRCDRCQYEFDVDDLHAPDDWNHEPPYDWLCVECWDIEEEESRYLEDDSDDEIIHSYSYSPYWRTHTLLEERFSDGISFELETEIDRGADRYNEAKKTLELGGELWGDSPFFASDDGSLDNGVEYTFHPFTYQWFKGNRKKLSEVLKRLSENCSSHNANTCGLHIHIDRNSASPLTIYKMIRFVYYNQSFIEFIAGRKANNYCSFAMEGTPVSKSRRTTDFDKFSAVNTGRSGTIEFRSFKGTLKPSTLFARIEFIVALRDFCRIASLRTKYPVNKLEEFVFFVAENHNKYRALATYFVEYLHKML